LNKLAPFASDWAAILKNRQEHITPEFSIMEAQKEY
jgi:hypothetical protein